MEQTYISRIKKFQHGMTPADRDISMLLEYSEYSESEWYWANIGMIPESGWIWKDCPACRKTLCWSLPREIYRANMPNHLNNLVKDFLSFYLRNIKQTGDFFNTNNQFLLIDNPPSIPLHFETLFNFSDDQWRVELQSGENNLHLWCFIYRRASPHQFTQHFFPLLYRK